MSAAHAHPTLRTIGSLTYAGASTVCAALGGVFTAGLWAGCVGVGGTLAMGLGVVHFFKR